ncbi:Uncharacterised protein [Mycobacteroides abscessus subsp. abscessus]|nr:Uncharacterised protein [Mycobacteroides abscessus subsp. abscessus]
MILGTRDRYKSQGSHCAVESVDLADSQQPHPSPVAEPSVAEVQPAAIFFGTQLRGLGQERLHPDSSRWCRLSRGAYLMRCRRRQYRRCRRQHVVLASVPGSAHG